MPSLPILLSHKSIYFDLSMQIYMTHEIKAPLINAMEILFDSKASKFQKAKAVKILWDVFQSMKCLPEPTKENTWHPNTHNLIGLRDWLFGKCKLDKGRMGLVRRVMNFVIVLYDFDPPWRWILDSVKDEAFKMEWKPRGFEDNWVKTYQWWQE